MLTKTINICLTVMLFLAPRIAWSQLNQQQLTGQMQTTNYNIYKGSPYFFDNFKIANLLLSGGETLQIDRVNYNLHSGNLIVYNPSVSKLIQVDKSILKEFTIENHRFILLINERNEPEFLEALCHGKIGLYVKHSTVILTGENNPNERHILGRLKASHQTIVRYSDGTNKKIKLKKHWLLKAFPEQKELLNEYMKINKVNLKRKNDLEKLFDYINEISNNNSGR